MPKVTKKPKLIRQKTPSERLLTVNEIKMKCIEHDLTSDLATKILFRILDDYHKNGTVYLNKELRLAGRYDLQRKYVVSLFNNHSQKDVVLIRALNETELTPNNKGIVDITDTWQRDESSDDDDEL